MKGKVKVNRIKTSESKRTSKEIRYSILLTVNNLSINLFDLLNKHFPRCT